MDSLAVAAALLSALLYAGWNAAVKASPNPTQAMTAQMIASAILCVPGFFWTGLPAAAAWPWIAGAVFFNTLAVVALLEAYRLAGFGAVYPATRACSVMLVVPMAALVLGEMLRPGRLAGIAMMVAGLLLLAGDNRGPGRVSPRAFGWILATGAAFACVVMCDAQGVRLAGNPLAYGFTVAAANAVTIGFRQRSYGPPWRIVMDNAAVGIPAAVAAMTSYLLILWVWSFAPIAPSAALRDTSAIFALIIAVVWLREPFTRRRLGAITLAAVAIPLLRLG